MTVASLSWDRSNRGWGTVWSNFKSDRLEASRIVSSEHLDGLGRNIITETVILRCVEVGNRCWWNWSLNQFACCRLETSLLIKHHTFTVSVILQANFFVPCFLSMHQTSLSLSSGTEFVLILINAWRQAFQLTWFYCLSSSPVELKSFTVIEIMKYDIWYFVNTLWFNTGTLRSILYVIYLGNFVMIVFLPCHICKRTKSLIFVWVLFNIARQNY